MTDQTETAEARVAQHFARDTAKHRLTFVREDGVHRHLVFRRPDTGMYWFELVTWPGTLAIGGDMHAFMFSRIEDMFRFFRGDRINPQYWAEKEQTRTPVKAYSQSVYEQLVREYFVEAVQSRATPRGLGKAVREKLLNTDWGADYDIAYEDEARKALAEFEYKGFRFHDTWEWDLSEWTHHFLWACHAIQWGIAQYDARTPVTTVELAEATR